MMENRIDNAVAKFEGMYDMMKRRRVTIAGDWELSASLTPNGFTMRRHYQGILMHSETDMHYAAMLTAIREQVGLIFEAYDEQRERQARRAHKGIGEELQ